MINDEKFTIETRDYMDAVIHVRVRQYDATKETSSPIAVIPVTWDGEQGDLVDKVQKTCQALAELYQHNTDYGDLFISYTINSHPFI